MSYLDKAGLTYFWGKIKAFVTGTTYTKTEVDAKIADVELAKSPNVTIFGNLTNNSGQLSGFSTANYAQFPFIMTLNRPFELIFSFTTGIDIVNQQNIFDSEFGLAFAIKDRHLLVAMSSDGSTWDLGAHTGSYTIRTNTTYYIRISWNGSLYTYDISTDGVNYQTDISVSSSAVLYPKTIVIGVGDLGSANPKVFKGHIDLNDAKLTFNGELFWQGMDDVGLSTRLATDLSNIDEAGKDRIKDIAAAAFIINEDDVTITTDSTKGVAPYSTSYGYTNVTISDTAGVKWVEGAVYSFVIDTKLVVASANRNVRVRIGETDSWHPVMNYTNTILAGSSYFIKAMTVLFQYKSVNQSAGALHLLYDSNTTYAYLVNNFTAGYMKIDANGYGARYSLAFPTSAPNAESETWSSLVKSSATGTTKAVVTMKLYADRHWQYIYSASIRAGAASANGTYQNYTGHDLRYTANTSNTWVSTLSKVFLHLKDFDTSDYSFKADATVGAIFSLDKLTTKFPSTTTGDVYLLHLGSTTGTWYTCNPDFDRNFPIYKYTPSTGEMVPFVKFSTGSYNDLSDKPTIPSAVTETTVSGWGFTKNAGTITGIKMNGASKGTSGVVDLGTVITSHQDISGKQDKITATNKLDYSLISGTPTIPSAVTESTVSGWGFTKNTGTYSKPSGGIPKTDLASAVQTSLGKADTALQSIPKASSTVLGGVKVGSGLSIDGNGVLSADGGTGDFVSQELDVTATGTPNNVNADTLGGKTYDKFIYVDPLGDISSPVPINADTLGGVSASEFMQKSGGTFSGNISAPNIPFRFGIDADGNYGYYKDGADTVTPFRNGGAVGTFTVGDNVSVNLGFKPTVVAIFNTDTSGHSYFLLYNNGAYKWTNFVAGTSSNGGQGWNIIPTDTGFKTTTASASYRKTGSLNYIAY